MSINTIVYATDFSDASTAALPMAASLARDNDARLLITHVIEQPVVEHTATYAQVAEKTKKEQTLLLDKIAPADPKIRYEHRVVEGSPSAAIVDLAESEKADMIVMGTHGRTGLKRLLMGSVAEAVVRRAPCSVLTVKPPA